MPHTQQEVQTAPQLEELLSCQHQTDPKLMSNPNVVEIEDMSSNNQELPNNQFFAKHTHDGNERSERSDNLSVGPAAHELPKDTYDKFFKICKSQEGANLTAQCDHCAAKVSKNV